MTAYDGLAGLKLVVADMLRDLEVRVLIYHKNRRYYLSRSLGKYHLESEYDRVLGMTKKDPQGSEWVYEVSRESNRILKVAAHNGAGIDNISLLLGDTHDFVFESVEPAVSN